MERRSYTLRDGELSTLHFGDTSEPLRLVLLHANGFNALAYRTLLEPLGVHSVAFDMRGHGQSRAMPQPKNMANWHIFRDDCVEFFERHLPDLTGYAGFDPVSVPFLFRLTSNLPGGRAYMKKRVPIARNAGRRKSEFDSPEAAFNRWQGRGAFKGMLDAVLRDYIEGGLVEREDGVWELACDPKWEQAIFVAQWHNLFKAARALPNNSRFIYAGGRPPVSTVSTRRAVQKAQPNINVEFDPTLGHLFPFIETERSIETLRDILSAV